MATSDSSHCYQLIVFSCSSCNIIGYSCLLFNRGSHGLGLSCRHQPTLGGSSSHGNLIFTAFVVIFWFDFFCLPLLMLPELSVPSWCYCTGKNSFPGQTTQCLQMSEEALSCGDEACFLGWFFLWWGSPWHCHPLLCISVLGRQISGLWQLRGFCP